MTDAVKEMKVAKGLTLSKKFLIWSMMVMLLLVALFYSYHKVASKHLKLVNTVEFLQDLTDLHEQQGSTAQKAYQEGTGTRIFQMANSLSNLDFIEGLKNNKYDCGQTLEDTNLENTQMHAANIDETTGLVELVIETYNHMNKKKTVGGDIFVIWAVEEVPSVQLPMSSRRVIAASVTDHQNGSYIGTLHVYWGGRFTIHARLLSISRTQCLRFKAMVKFGNSVFSLPNLYGIVFNFSDGNFTDSTRCGPINYIYGYNKLCNFTSLNYDYLYYCGHPANGLNCSHVTSFNMRKYDTYSMNLQRPKHDIIVNPGWGKLSKTIAIDVHNLTLETQNKLNTTTLCKFIPNAHSWNMYPSEMFIQNGTWNHVACTHMDFTETNIQQCLSNKKLFFIGDSTIRQYIESIGSSIRESVEYFHFYVKLFSERHDINITWRKHELPFHNVMSRNPFEVNGTDNQIRNIANDPSIPGSKLILLLTYNVHLQAFPPSVFRDRIKRLVNALQFLFTKKPETTVLFRGPHMTKDQRYWFEARMSLIYMEILQEEFVSLRDKVRYLDVFTLSVLNDNQSLHPLGQALENQLQQFLSYICA